MLVSHCKSVCGQNQEDKAGSKEKRDSDIRSIPYRVIG